LEAIQRFTKSLEKIEETPSQQELAQKKKAERDRAERERVAKLSAEEQRKFIERERKSTQKSLPHYLLDLIIESQKVRKA